MSDEEVIAEDEQDLETGARQLAQRMDRLRLTGRLLMALGVFLVQTADLVQNIQTVGPQNGSDQGDWFTR